MSEVDLWQPMPPLRDQRLGYLAALALLLEMKSGARLVLIEFKEGKLPEGPPEAVKVPRAELVKLVTTAGLVPRDGRSTSRRSPGPAARALAPTLVRAARRWLPWTAAFLAGRSRTTSA